MKHISYIYSLFIHTDPMSRYLSTAQMVPICELHIWEWIFCVVTMGQTLYVTEMQPMWPYLNGCKPTCTTSTIVNYDTKHKISRVKRTTSGGERSSG